MAADPRLSNAAASTAATAIGALINTTAAGWIVFYTATIPTDADTALGAQVALSTCTFSAAAFSGVSNGTATFDTITGSTAGAAGTATWARIYSGATASVMDVTVGTSGEDVNFNSNIFSAGASVDITSLKIIVPKT